MNDMISTDPKTITPTVLARSNHSISRKQIDADSLKVLYRLNRNGHKAYLVGGSVRDLLLGRQPKDFDVGTDATPGQVRKLFRNCFLVGRRFRLAHIRFGKENLIEVATFRRQPEPGELPEDPADHFGFVENVFGSPAEDAFRRDFTINALFYDINDFSIIDYVGGLKDLEEGRIRVIGDPLVRFTEDPVRMLRALEFSARLGFSVDEATREAIYQRAPLIAEAAPSRLRDELMELFRHKVGGTVLRDTQAMGLLAPLLAGYHGEEATFTLLDQFDQRTRSGSPPPEEPFVLAALFLEEFARKCPIDGQQHIGEALRIANQLLTPHCQHFRISHGVRHIARELLVGIFRLRRGPGFKGERRFLRHPQTPMSLELFALWQQAQGEDETLANAWRELLAKSPAQPQNEPPPEQQQGRPRRRRPRRRSRKPRPNA